MFTINQAERAEWKILYNFCKKEAGRIFLFIFIFSFSLRLAIITPVRTLVFIESSYFALFLLETLPRRSDCITNIIETVENDLIF